MFFRLRRRLARNFHFCPAYMQTLGMIFKKDGKHRLENFKLVETYRVGTLSSLSIICNVMRENYREETGIISSRNNLNLYTAN